MAVSLDFSEDEALVLFDFLTRYGESDRLEIADQAEQRVLWNLRPIGRRGLRRSRVNPVLRRLAVDGRGVPRPFLESGAPCSNQGVAPGQHEAVIGAVSTHGTPARRVANRIAVHGRSSGLEGARFSARGRGKDSRVTGWL